MVMKRSQQNRVFEMSNKNEVSPGPGFASAPVEGEDFIVTAGKSLENGVGVAGEEALKEAFRTVFDPEIPVNIYDLGLIYGFWIDDQGGVKVEMSLTAPGCPVAGELPQWVADAAAKVDGIGSVEVKLVWDPGWTPELMSEDAKLALGMM
jgi:FeS assembly SUF system protein